MKSWLFINLGEKIRIIIISLQLDTLTTWKICHEMPSTHNSYPGVVTPIESLLFILSMTFEIALWHSSWDLAYECNWIPFCVKHFKAGVTTILHHQSHFLHSIAFWMCWKYFWKNTWIIISTCFFTSKHVAYWRPPLSNTFIVPSCVQNVYLLAGILPQREYS